MAAVTAHPALHELPTWGGELLQTERVAHLGILDPQGRPRVLPITFAVVGPYVWSAVDDKPKRRAGENLARVRWLRDRPAATVTIDRYDEDWSRLAWVQVVGIVTVLEAREHRDALAALAARYPQYRDALPAGPLLRLAPERVVCWRASEAAP